MISIHLELFTQLSSAPPAPLHDIQNLLLAHAAKQVPVPDLLHAPLLNSLAAQLEVASVGDLCGSVLAIAQAKLQPDASLLRALLTYVSASQVVFVVAVVVGWLWACGHVIVCMCACGETCHRHGAPCVRLKRVL